MTAPDATGHIEIAATPEAVYAIISDATGLTEISDETSKVIQRKSVAGQQGSHFVGINRNGWRAWPTVSKVTDADPGKRFAFTVSSTGIPVSRWQYDIEPSDTGCRVTESTWDRRPGWFIPLTAPVTGVKDRVTTNTRNIETTLRRLKAKAEEA